jgi:hypothetical protein
MERNTTLHLLDEARRLMEENKRLKVEHTTLRQELLMSHHITEDLLIANKDWKQKNDEHVEEKKYLFNIIQKLKHRVCDEDCVLCVIVRICQTKLGLSLNLCCRQLEKIIIWYANPQIKLEDLMCVRFMDVLEKCEIVTKYGEYNYSPKMIGKYIYDEMFKAWSKLMTADDSLHVVIIGRVISGANCLGHAELCDLDTRTTKTADGMVTIHDAQDETWRRMGQQDFINHVQNDEGVIFYTVNVDKLKQIINHCSHILHLKISDQQLYTQYTTDFYHK